MREIIEGFKVLQQMAIDRESELHKKIQQLQTDAVNDENTKRYFLEMNERAIKDLHEQYEQKCKDYENKIKSMSLLHMQEYQLFDEIKKRNELEN